MWGSVCRACLPRYTNLREGAGSLYRSFGGLFLLITDIAMIIYAINSEAEWPIYVSIILTIRAVIHLNTHPANEKSRKNQFFLISNR